MTSPSQDRWVIRSAARWLLCLRILFSILLTFAGFRLAGHLLFGVIHGVAGIAWVGIPWLGAAVALMCLALRQARSQPARWVLAFAILNSAEIAVMYGLGGQWMMSAGYAAVSWAVVLIAWGASRRITALGPTARFERGARRPLRAPRLA